MEDLGPELFSRELKLRKAFLHRHLDVAGRPVLVAIAERHNVLQRRLEESCQMCAWFMERALDQLSTKSPDPENERPEQPEQALGIFDLRGFSPLQADLEFARFLVDTLYIYYPGRFGRLLLVDAPPGFAEFWETMRPLLHRYAALAEFVTAKEVVQLYFEPGCAPAEFEAR